MDQRALKIMRIKQLVSTNALVIALFAIYLALLSAFEVRMSQMFFVLGAIVFAQTLLRWISRKSTKSVIPFFEQVAIYEKQKMGNEWRKQYNTGLICNFFLSGIFLLQAFWSRGSTDIAIQMELRFMLLLALCLVIMINIALCIHIRKVDRSKLQSDFKGYTLKTNIIGAVVGLVVAFAMFVGITFYVLTLS
ncbi:hypothetical protein [Halobacillus naozhouensis]|uniref:Uncharacterized protein n=1 Tax=Halobacillus naozhouensis TaxID=554880 RepID=A0ABY8IVX7_9BACI|nr:hypothetical protein [Halobacillus naozhouensis]WFT74155.1 hypothetical protein P9989_17580 [Halobacillus naozhouensis]